MFTCPFCNYSDIRKISIIRHLSIKKKCNKEVHIDLYNKAINYLKEQKYTFKNYPNEIINYKNYNKNEMNVDNILEFLNNNPIIKKDIIDFLENNNNNPTINDISNNPITTPIVITPWENPDISYITNEVFTNLLNNPNEIINKLIELIYFNKDQKQNHSICFISKKPDYNYVYVWTGENWDYYDKKILFNEIIENVSSIIRAYLLNNEIDFTVSNKMESYINDLETNEKLQEKLNKTIKLNCFNLSIKLGLKSPIN
jgi:hypothetical protein